MQRHFVEILQHPTDLLAVLEPEHFGLMACNKSFANYFRMDPTASDGKGIFETLGINVSPEKRDGIKQHLSEHFFYIETRIMADHYFYFNVARNTTTPYLILRVSNIIQNNDLQQYKQLFQKDIAGVYHATAEGEIKSCNETFAKILGYSSPKELIGTNTKFLYKNDANRYHFLEQIRSNSQIVNYEIEVLRKDQSSATCLENAYFEKLPNGEEVISGILIDISDKKKLEIELHDSEARYRTLASVTKESVVFCKDEKIIDCNDQFVQLFGYHSRSEILGQKLANYINQQDIHRVDTTLELADLNYTELRSYDKDGEPLYLEMRGNQLRYKDHDTIAYVINNITEQKKIEHALEQSVVRFRNLLEHLPNGVIILVDEKIRYLNYAACSFFNVADEDEVYDANFLQFISPAYINVMKRDLDYTRNGGEEDYKEIKLLNAEGAELDAGIKCTLTVYENKPSIQITLNNLTDRKQLVEEQVRVRLIEEINTVLKSEIEEHKITQKKLKTQQREALEQKAKLESVINSTENLMMWTVDSRFRITTMNKNFASWMKEFYEENVTLGKDIVKILKKHVDPDFYQGQLTAFENTFKGRPQQLEFALKNKRGQTVWLQAFLNPVYMDDNLEQISCLVYDNSERKQMDRQVRDSLKEKEVLLQEVHHRVKNNLQIISSILNLQASYVSDPVTLNILQESQQRIKSMSFIHETLYRTADFGRLEFTQYVSTIVNNLVQSYRRADCSVELLTTLDDVYLSLDQSIPCGLIVNELISNAMKYAWKGKNKGVLKVNLHEELQGNVFLTIEDDGVGLPKTFLFEKNDSLGIQLVYSLLEQLDAKMAIKSDSNGTSFSISFRKL